MRASHPDEVRALLRSALDALKRGDRNAARSLAEQAASLAPGSEEPLLFLGALTSPEVSLAYIRQALRINPESQVAQQALEWALKRQRNQSAAPEDDLFEIGPLLSARLAILAESVLEPDPPPKPTHPSTSPSISAETLPEPEPTSEPIQLPTSPAIPAETLPEPAPLSEPIQSPASPAVPIPASAMPEPQAESIHRTAGSAIPGDIQPSPPATKRKKFSLSPARIVVFSLLGFGVLVLVALLGLWFRGPLLQRLTQVGQALPTASAIPTIFIPTPDCGPPTLVLGSTTFQIQNLDLAPDGSFLVPPDTPSVAYWVEGADPNFMFVLSPTQENLSLIPTINVESTAKTIWSNCNSTTYSLLAPEPGSLNASMLPDQSLAGITVFVQTDASGNGFVVKGELTEEQISTFNTPASSGTEVQAEIGLMETTTSPDGNTIQLTVSIYNFGGTPFTISTSDVSLTPPSATPLEMTRSDPRLPREIRAAETETFTLTFSRPSTPTATLRIFTVEYDIEGY